MGIWIRSQDRKVLKEVSNIECYSRLFDKETKILYELIEMYNADIFNEVYTINGLGIYSTQEKAIKVLDMIQDQLRIGLRRVEHFKPYSVQTRWA